MKRYNFFHALGMAFYSKALYRDVARHWRGTGILYILLLSIISLLVFMGLQTRHSMLHDFIDSWVRQVPTLTIKQGVVNIDKPAPYFIYDPNKGTVAVIIDTSGTITSLQNTPATVLITRNTILTKDAAGNITTKELSGVQDFSLSATDLEKFLFGILFFFYFLGSFLFSLIGLLVCAALVNLFTSATLSFAALCRLTAVAFTPTTWLNIVLNLLNFHLPFQWIICLVIILGYILYAVDANKDASSPPGASDASSTDMEKKI